MQNVIRLPYMSHGGEGITETTRLYCILCVSLNKPLASDFRLKLVADLLIIINYINVCSEIVIKK